MQRFDKDSILVSVWTSALMRIKVIDGYKFEFI